MEVNTKNTVHNSDAVDDLQLSLAEDNQEFNTEVLYEDTSKRSENVKHFRMKNGSYMAAVYEKPVHILDEKTGEYKDIPHRFEECEDCYEAETGCFKARFPKKEGKRKYVAVERNGHSVSWRYLSQSSSHRKHATVSVTFSKPGSRMELPRFPKLQYEKTESRIDLEYGITDTGVKENIILHKRPKNTVFRFDLQLAGLKAILSDDKKSVNLFALDTESSEPEFVIPPANMTDAGGAYSEAAHYALTETENGFILELIAEPEWLLAEERLYPVTVDPQVTIPSALHTTPLTMTAISSDGSRVSSGDYRKVGVDECGNIHRLYIKADLSAFPENSKITKASLAMYQHLYRSTAGLNTYKVYPVASAWSSNTITWANKPNIQTNDPIATFSGYKLAATTPLELDITDLAEAWQSSSVSNNGIVILAPDAEKDLGSNCECECCEENAEYQEFNSSTYSPSNYRAALYITYISEDAYADHQKYETFENGRAGTGSINLFTGKLSFAHGDVSAEGVKLPLAVSHVYRSVNLNDSDATYGKGWRLSVEQTLKVVNSYGVRAIYTNAQGKRHFFIQGKGSTIVDESGLGLSFCDCSGNGEDSYIYDNKGNYLYFNASGKLCKLKDANGNISTLTYSDDRLVQVVDGGRNTATLQYDSKGRLSRIIDTTGINSRAITYSYTDGRLTTIRYPSLSDANEVLTTNFTYDATTGYLTSVTDQTGIQYTIAYTTDGKVSRISQQGTLAVTPTGVTTLSTAESGGSISFQYNAHSTAVKDDQTGIKTVYRFDENGRELSSYEDLTELSDTSLRSESTRTKISNYNNILSYADLSPMTSKYRSVSASITGAADTMTNLLVNGCFTQMENDFPKGWTKGIIAKNIDGVSDHTYLPGRKSFLFDAIDATLQRSIFQDVSIDAATLEGNILIASAWAKVTQAIPVSTDPSAPKFRLRLTVAYSNGESAEYYESFDGSRTDWQYVAIPVALDRSRTPTSARVRLEYGLNTKACYFTNARLVAVNGVVTTNEYYSKSSTPYVTVFNKSQFLSNTSYSFDGVLLTTNYQNIHSDTVMTKVTDLDNNTFVSYYQYDSNHNVIKAQDYRGTVTEYTYDDSGKQLTQKTYHVDTPKCYMFSENTYQGSHFLTSERDPRYKVNGKELKVNYEYDTQRGIMTKRTDTNGQEYNYSYDANTDDLRTLSSAVNETSHENRFFYKQGYLTKVEHNGFHFGFSYDALGRSTKVCVGDNASCVDLLSTVYEDGVTDKVTTTYATGEKSQVITDIRGNPVRKTYTSANNVTKTISTATYDEVGNPLDLVDKVKGVCYHYTYNNDGNVVSVVESSESCDCEIATNTTTYDKHKRVISQTYGATGQTYETLYEKEGISKVYPDGEAIGVYLEDHFSDRIERDGLGRVKKKTLKSTTLGGYIQLMTDTYSYLNTTYNEDTENKIETSFVSSITQQVSPNNISSLQYTYDDAGNIETVSQNGSPLFKYYYDGLNRLVREDNYPNDEAYVWSYNVGGNITEKRIYKLVEDINLSGDLKSTVVYQYATSGWRDQLTSYNNQQCTYDRMGNPTLYRGNDLTWTHVRQLASYGSNTFAYGADGVRYRKNSTTYTVNGSKILRETNGDRTLTYYYGGSGVVGFCYNGTDYYYQKNLQGDVIAIYSNIGERVAEYLYDAWGKVLRVTNHTSDHTPDCIGDLNPFRYRGYYYDTETGLYYLNTRYYDPETGRFISSDTTEVLDNAKNNIGGLNLYAYCDNKPVSGRDDDGTMSFWEKLAIAAAVVVAIAVVAAVVTVATGGTGTMALCAMGSTFLGAAKGAAIGAVTGAVQGAVTGAVTGAIEGYMEDGWDGVLAGAGRGAWKGAVQGAQDGLLSGMVMGGLGGAAQALSGHGTLCFVAGTTILTTLGKKAIETIKVGDTLPCVDHITGERAEKRVVSTSANKVDKLVELEIGGEIIRCTDTHPFQVKDKGWVKAEKLQPGDLIYDKDWNTSPVQRIDIIHLTEPVEVFNFEVEDCHTYYVGDGFWLVHNGGCNHGSEWRRERKRYWKTEAEMYNGKPTNELSNSGTYIADKFNLNRMRQGKAPLDLNGIPVQLHHYKPGGITADLYAYYEITFSDHFSNFKALHSWLF